MLGSLGEPSPVAANAVDGRRATRPETSRRGAATSAVRTARRGWAMADPSSRERSHRYEPINDSQYVQGKALARKLLAILHAILAGPWLPLNLPSRTRTVWRSRPASGWTASNCARP